MSKTSNKNGKSDADKLGEKRMKQYEERQKIQEVVLASDEEEYIVTAYQKIEPGEWEKVEIKYKRKKKL